jgi:lysophospholipase L1-like esterase
MAADAPPGKPAAARIVCFGDSITKQGYPELVGKALGVETINAGVGGNTTANGLKRIQKDVLDHKPTVVIVFFGTNDSRPSDEPVHVPVEKYQANLEQIVDLCQKAGAKVVVCTPPPIDAEPYFKRHKREKIEAAGGLEKVLGQYRAAAVRAAEAKKAIVVDLNQLFAKEKQAEWLSPDGVHPTAKGKEMIARWVADAVKPLVADVRK